MKPAPRWLRVATVTFAICLAGGYVALRAVAEIRADTGANAWAIKDPKPSAGWEQDLERRGEAGENARDPAGTIKTGNVSLRAPLARPRFSETISPSSMMVSTKSGAISMGGAISTGALLYTGGPGLPSGLSASSLDRAELSRANVAPLSTSPARLSL